MNKKILLLFSGALLSITVSANESHICSQASKKIDSIIEEWFLLVKDSDAEEKNLSVLSMYADFNEGSLEMNFMSHCKENWTYFQDTFQCFSAIRTEIGAAICLHPDTNKNGWRY